MDNKNITQFKDFNELKTFIDSFEAKPTYQQMEADNIKAGKQMPRIYLACGVDDFLLNENNDFADFLKENNLDKYLINCLGVYDKFDDIDFDKLPNQFVLKCTHDSGTVIVCKNKNQLENFILCFIYFFPFRKRNKIFYFRILNCFRLFFSFII